MTGVDYDIVRFVFEVFDNSVSNGGSQCLNVEQVLSPDTVFSKSPCISSPSSQVFAPSSCYFEVAAPVIHGREDSTKDSPHLIQLSVDVTTDHQSSPRNAESLALSTTLDASTATIRQLASIPVDLIPECATSPGSSCSTSQDHHQFRQEDYSRLELSALYSSPETICKVAPWRLRSPDEPMLLRYFVTDLSRFVSLFSNRARLSLLVEQ